MMTPEQEQRIANLAAFLHAKREYFNSLGMMNSFAGTVDEQRQRAIEYQTMRSEVELAEAALAKARSDIIRESGY